MNVVTAALIILAVLRIINENVYAGSFTSPMPVVYECGACAQIYDPVCASNGNYYDNECKFHCAKEMAAMGQSEDFHTTDIYIVDCPD